MSTNARDELREIERRLKAVRSTLKQHPPQFRDQLDREWMDDDLYEAETCLYLVLKDYGDELATIQIGQCGEGE